MSDSQQPSPGATPSVDPVRLRISLDNLYGILTQIARRADEVSQSRCPYKNRHDRCTAHFGCRNQRRTGGAGELPLCAGDDKLDYRKSWET